MPVTALNLYLRHTQNYKLSTSHRLICITETCFNKLFRGKVIHLKWHLTAQNVNRIQQAAVQVLLHTVLLSHLTSENLKQEISYSRKFLCLLHFLQSNTSKTHNPVSFHSISNSLFTNTLTLYAA